MRETHAMIDGDRLVDRVSVDGDDNNMVSDLFDGSVFTE